MARVPGGPLAIPQHNSDRIHGCWRGWEQGWRAQGALSTCLGCRRDGNGAIWGRREMRRGSPGLGGTMEGFTVNQQL